MKVKIGDVVYDAAIQPIMVIFSDADKQNIANMLPEATKYCSFPDTIPSEEIIKWMDDVPDAVKPDQ